MANTIAPTDSFSFQFQAVEEKKTSVVESSSTGEQQTISVEQLDAVSINISAQAGDAAKPTPPEAGYQAHRAERRFKAADANGDGSLSLDELQSLKDKLAANGRESKRLDAAIKNFSALDQDQSGGLTFREIHPRAQTAAPAPAPSEQNGNTDSAAAAAPAPSNPPATGETSDADIAKLLEKAEQTLKESGAKTYTGTIAGSTADEAQSKPASPSIAGMLNLSELYSSVLGNMLPGGDSSGTGDALTQVVQVAADFQAAPEYTEQQTLSNYGIKTSS